GQLICHYLKHNSPPETDRVYLSFNILSQHPRHTSHPDSPISFASDLIVRKGSFRDPETSLPCSVCFPPHKRPPSRIHMPLQALPPQGTTIFDITAGISYAILFSAHPGMDI